MKADRIVTEIEKTRAKIGEMQARLRSLEQQKTEQENTEIIELVRAIDATPAEITVMLRALRESQRQQAMTSLAPQVEDDAGADDTDTAGDEQEDTDDEA
jgi:hypothetical protein